MARWVGGFVVIEALIIWTGASVLAQEGVDSSNVYQRIKDVDDNGLSVGRFTGGAEPTTDIVLDEQGKATGGRNNDAADRPLFRAVKEAKLAAGSYPEFIALLDNYVLRTSSNEDISDDEDKEIEKFLDKALATRPMTTAFAYITGDHGLGLDMTPDKFRSEVKRIWFELYTNHFGNNRTPFCSGFEHVFVGEGKYAAGGAGPRKGEVSGYHSWVKFLRDEKAGAANYLGTKYDLPPARLPTNPGVITLRILLKLEDPPGGPAGAAGANSVELFKPKGGFFVGMSPECELALGTVAFFEHGEGLYTNDKRRAAIDGATYDLVMFRSVNPGGNRGDHIRSFYPVLIGPAISTPDDPPPVSDGPLVIVRALPNPEGDDETGEWVEVKNDSDVAVDVNNWELRDNQNGTRPLDGTLAAGEVKKFEIPRSMFSMRLGNRGGKIRLFSDGEQIQEVSYGDAATDKVFEF